MNRIGKKDEIEIDLDTIGDGYLNTPILAVVFIVLVLLIVLSK